MRQQRPPPLHIFWNGKIFANFHWRFYFFCRSWEVRVRGFLRTSWEESIGVAEGVHKKYRCLRDDRWWATVTNFGIWLQIWTTAICSGGTLELLLLWNEQKQKNYGRSEEAKKTAPKKIHKSPSVVYWAETGGQTVSQSGWRTDGRTNINSQSSDLM